MNYLKSQTNSFQIRFGFAIVVVGGVSIALSPFFFLILVPIGSYSLVLGLGSRIKSKFFRIVVIVPMTLLLAVFIGGTTLAVVNPESIDGKSSSQVIESETPEPEVLESETPEPEPIVSTISPSPSRSAGASKSPAPTIGSAPPAASVAPVAPVAPAQPTSNCQPGQVDINTAPEEQLLTIIHIGPERVPELISLRPYSSIEGLDDISGIGDARMADIRTQGVACVG